MDTHIALNRCYSQSRALVLLEVAVMTFRCIVIEESRRRTTLVLPLPGAPLIGDELVAPHGETIIVHRVTSTSRDGLGRVIIAATT